MKLRLRYWRKRRVLSIPDLAKKAHVSTATISKIENDGYEPGPSVIRRLAAGLEVSLDDLLIVEEEDTLQKVS